jgi:hypothetical protein
MIMKVEESMIPFESATRPIYSRDGRAFVREGEMYLKNEKNTDNEAVTHKENFHTHHSKAFTLTKRAGGLPGRNSPPLGVMAISPECELRT